MSLARSPISTSVRLRILVTLTLLLAVHAACRRETIKPTSVAHAPSNVDATADASASDATASDDDGRHGAKSSESRIEQRETFPTPDASNIDTEKSEDGSAPSLSPDQQAGASDTPPVTSNDGTHDAIESVRPSDASDASDDSGVQRHDATTSAKDPPSSKDDESEGPQNSSDPINDATNPVPAAARVLLMSDHGPLLLDLHVSIDGRPQTDVVQDLVDEVMRLADTDGDGAVTWDEAMSDPDFRYGQYGNTVPESLEQQEQLIYGYDMIRNGRMDREEVLGFLNSRGNRLIDVVGFYREDRPEPPLFTWLDVDQSRMLEPHELAASLDRARVLDRNDDWMIDRSELPSEQAPDNQQRRRNRNAPRIVAVLTPEIDWSRLLYSIEERYAYGSPIQAVDLLREPLFQAIDKDQDGRWDRSEVSGLLELPADAKFDVAFGAEPKLRIEAVEPSTKAESGSSEKAARLWFEDMQVDFQLRDASGSPFGSQEQYEMLWQRWDTTTDGYLDTDEYRAVQGAFSQLEFAAVDVDGDEKIYPEEATKVLLQRQAAQRSRIQFEVVTDDSLLWNRLDQDQDNRLSERELRNINQRLADVLDDSGSLDPNQLSAGLRVRIVRGDADAAGPLPVGDRQARQVTVDAPAWFQQMDRNRDGALALHEFLGSAEQFEKLDQDSSGFVEPSEIAE